MKRWPFLSFFVFTVRCPEIFFIKKLLLWETDTGYLTSILINFIQGPVNIPYTIIVFFKVSYLYNQKYNRRPTRHTSIQKIWNLGPGHQVDDPWTSFTFKIPGGVYITESLRSLPRFVILSGRSTKTIWDFHLIVTKSGITFSHPLVSLRSVTTLVVPEKVCGNVDWDELCIPFDRILKVKVSKV